MHHFHLKNGSLFVEDVAVDQLARKFGTPLYVYSRKTLLDHYGRLDAALSDLDHLICYAAKANSNLAVLSTLAKAGSGFDIVSAGELYRVMAAGGDARRCTFAGVGKTRDEIEFALDQGIYAFICESEAEVQFIDKVAGALRKKAPIAVRVNPNVDAGTHHKITTGTYENKFGIAYEEIPGVYARSAQLKNVVLRGVHMHIGSQITSTKPFLAAVKKMLPLVQKLKAAHELEFFDIGGGLGIVYDQALESGPSKWWGPGKKEMPLTPASYAEAVVPLLKNLGLRILVEPGRFIAGNSGILVTEVLYVKKTSQKNFVVVDAAMNDLIRPAFYEAYHEVVPLKKNRGGRKISTDLVGPICESGDVFCKNRMLPPLVAGDRIAFLSAGAYGFAMASNYNSRPKAAEILVHGKKVLLARKRESFPDLVRGESVT